MSRKHTDRSGTFSLDKVHAVTPYNTTEVVQDTHRPGQTVRVDRRVGQLHFDSGHSLTTDTDYDELTKKVFGEAGAT